MQIKRFEDIVAWQRAKELNLIAYKALSKCRDYYFKDQYLRAALSIMNNIAEGYGRRSSKEFRQYLHIAQGSCDESKSMLYLALEFKHVDQSTFNLLYNLSEEISKILHGFINSIPE